MIRDIVPHLGMVLMCTLIIFTACRSRTPDPVTAPYSARIIGTWKKTFDAIDINGNGSPDPSEKTSLAAGQYEYQTYYSNGTMTDSLRLDSLTGKFNGSWTIYGDIMSLTIAGKLTTVELAQLDADNLIIANIAANPLEWAGYVRQ